MISTTIRIKYCTTFYIFKYISVKKYLDCIGDFTNVSIYSVRNKPILVYKYVALLNVAPNAKYRTTDAKCRTYNAKLPTIKKRIA